MPKWGDPWTESDVIQYERKFKGSHSATVQTSDLESNLVDGSSAKDESQKVHPRFRIHCHSKRRRLCDPDGVSAKWAIDGLTKGGIIGDDSQDWIETISFSQELSETEETVIEIWEIT